VRLEPEGIEPLKLDRALAGELDVVDRGFVYDLSTSMPVASAMPPSLQRGRSQFVLFASVPATE
jgi:hypothetical protein